MTIWRKVHDLINEWTNERMNERSNERTDYLSDVNRKSYALCLKGIELQEDIELNVMLSWYILS